MIKIIFTAATGLIISSGALALSMQKLSDNDIQSSSHIQSGVACWNYINKETFLYSDMSNTIVKIDGNVINLKVSGPNADIHSNENLNIAIKSLKNGNLEIVKGGVKSVMKTKSKCGD